MILIWLLLIIALIGLTKWYVTYLMNQHKYSATKLIVTISCAIQLIFIYGLVKELIRYLIQILNVFYR
ncbi:hypothetical protein [Staphylococcus cohnii]|uniref:DUF1146 domain-containing protein n=1 Tax=Staphylococcus cohnii TaxID=29382 RepID=A0ABT6IZ24_9STAP|nr:hypothetical protein [Staphylococcus cohnii]GEP87215.1 hypothetical protein SCO01_14050 [Staphylococcus cohnii subsp. cohnii]MDH5157762.1 hypothetical protein [Staphylococcus cohnii]MDH5169506.1 hypothetical protein [Staphylococcus cohnii]WQJ57808.1 hypothetical protein P3T93_10225 [Staphylococcus cohnii]SUM09335.1 Uncharacterised protein [Staphylococcus cohnii]